MTSSQYIATVDAILDAINDEVGRNSNTELCAAGWSDVYLTVWAADIALVSIPISVKADTARIRTRLRILSLASELDELAAEHARGALPR